MRDVRLVRDTAGAVVNRIVIDPENPPDLPGFELTNDDPDLWARRDRDPVPAPPPDPLVERLDRIERLVTTLTGVVADRLLEPGERDELLDELTPVVDITPDPEVL